MVESETTESNNLDTLTEWLGTIGLAGVGSSVFPLPVPMGGLSDPDHGQYISPPARTMNRHISRGSSADSQKGPKAPRNSEAAGHFTIESLWGRGFR